jgi:hypothetical protein
MPDSRFAINPHFVEFEQLLIRLHHLFVKGEGDSEEADALREAMEEPERNLSSAERARLEGLSADLYMIQDDEIFEKVEPEERTRERLGPELELAYRAEDWDKVLSLLRRGPDFLTRDQLAASRAFLYRSLGHSEAADLFGEYAQRLTPHQPVLAPPTTFDHH